jgi:hypothetical protein
VQIIRASGIHRFRGISDQGQDHGDIVRCKTPQNVLFPPHLPEVEPIGIDILQPAKIAPIHELFQLQECRVILQQVTDHKASVDFFGESTKRFCLLRIKGEGFLDENMFPGEQCLARQCAMQHRRRRDRDCIDRGIAEQFCPFPGRNTRGFRLRTSNLFRRVVDRTKGTEFAKIAHEVLAPIAAAGHRDPYRRRILVYHSIFRKCAGRDRPMLPHTG